MNNFNKLLAEQTAKFDAIFITDLMDSTQEDSRIKLKQYSPYTDCLNEVRRLSEGTGFAGEAAPETPRLENMVASPDFLQKWKLV